MSIEIVNQEIDLAGKYRVWTEVAPNELTMFKFDKAPTQEMVGNALTNLIESQKNSVQTELDMVNEQIFLLTERKEVLEDELNGSPD